MINFRTKLTTQLTFNEISERLKKSGLNCTVESDKKIMFEGKGLLNMIFFSMLDYTAPFDKGEITKINDSNYEVNLEVSRFLWVAATPILIFLFLILYLFNSGELPFEILIFLFTFLLLMIAGSIVLPKYRFIWNIFKKKDLN